MGKLLDKLRRVQAGGRPFCTMIVPAAGSSARMGGGDKLMMELEGVPVLVRTLRALDAAQLVDEIIIATREARLLEVADLCRRCGLRKPVRVVQGGENRTQSVLAAACETDVKAQFIAVHDGARPLVLPEDVDAVIRFACQTHAAAPALPVTDTVKTADETYLVDLVGENLGILIGRRGETLDAIQHLANYAVNRGQNKRVRINVDAENYRAKREQSLENLAHKVAGKVLKYRRSVTLEPMNAYERHVIHAALQDYPNVTTYSTGVEPNRRTVVAYAPGQK